MAVPPCCISEADRYDSAQEFGEVENARVLRGNHGEGKGVGFVQFVHPEDAEAAITGMNGRTVGPPPLPPPPPPPP